jgi:hypothetical protein
MACPARRKDGSGYTKPTDTVLQAENDAAFAVLLAEREAQEAQWRAAYTAPEPAVEEGSIEDALRRVHLTSVPLTHPEPTVPPSETCFEVDGHYYKLCDPERAAELSKALDEREAARRREDDHWKAIWKEVSGGDCEPVSVVPVVEHTDIWMKDDAVGSGPISVTAPAIATVTVTVTATADSNTKIKTTDLPVIEITELT